MNRCNSEGKKFKSNNHLILFAQGLGGSSALCLIQEQEQHCCRHVLGHCVPVLEPSLPDKPDLLQCPPHERLSHPHLFLL